MRTTPDLLGLFSGALVVAVAFLYRGNYFLWTPPPIWVSIAASGAIFLAARRIPVWATLYLLAGAIGLSWSLAPGHTLLNVLWEALYVGLLAACYRPSVLVLLNVILLLLGLEQVLLLDWFGFAQYFSGSIHYVAGAQGLLALPLFLWGAARARSVWGAVLFLLAAGLALFLVLGSGSRAVYLSLVLMGPLLAWRLFRASTGSWRRSVFLVAGPLLVVSLLDIGLPGSPVGHAAGVRAWTAMLATLEPDRGPAGSESDTTSAEFAGQGGAEDDNSGRQLETPPPAESAVEDGIRSRLRMWEQAWTMGLRHPFGTGAATFREVVHAYQLHASVGFSSAHNVFLETFATGGWLRLLLLLALILPALVRGWIGESWPYALGAAGLWLTMSFDVTAQMPAVMALAFASLGPLIVSERPGGGSRNAGSWLARGSALLAVAAAAYWYVPCESSRCSVERYLGFRPHVLSALGELPPSEREELAASAVDLNPRSLWAWQALFEAETDPVEKLALAAEIAERFPRSSQAIYLQWADLALSQGRKQEAIVAIREGLDHFPPGYRPAGTPLVSRGDQQAIWLGRANSILEAAEGQ